ncbi:MAG: hypothetical protein JM58_10075 [Peptococcaceae bacterium BICA1-8]|nr:MAG: hypothetical protein JM58_10075 [Peptococcaceae bacterium BICA1-8]
MYCANCGTQLPEKAKFCTGCGLEVLPDKPKVFREKKNVVFNNPQYVGFSPKIDDPRFARYSMASKNWAFLFSIIIAAIAVIAFPIYGSYSGEVDWPYSLYYGMGIGGMFVTIALVQNFKKSRDSTWDGVVDDKRIYEKKHWDKNNDTYTTNTVYEYKVRRDDNGKIYEHSTENNDIVYNYYNIGDKVRHHKGFGYEKYDKSKDTFLFCIACASINDIANEDCFRCKCPLLK